MRAHQAVGIALVAAAIILTGLATQSKTQDNRRALYIHPNITQTAITDKQAQEILQRTRYPDELWTFSLRISADGTRKPGSHNDFPSRIHRLRPQTQVLTAFGFDAKTNSLNDSARAATLRSTITTFLDEYGYDGVVLDMEPLRNGDPVYIEFIKDLKAAAPNKRIGVYGFRISENGSWWDWDSAYLAKVAEAADFVQLALYNTRIRAKASDGTYSAASYQSWIRNQTATVDLLGIDNKIYWGLPAYQGSAAHIVAIENIGIAGPFFYDRHTAIYNEAYMTEGDYELYDAFLTRTLPEAIT